MAKAYYNEIDPEAAKWLQNLIHSGLIAPGDVDTRSIEDVRPDDLSGYTQCHFFAGIGVWSYALRLSGWGDDRRVWTGSCPCQPFSEAGKGVGFADERHLWPAFFHLIAQCRPDVAFGEQVASSDGLAWLDLVQADLEAEGYSSAAVDLCAAGFGAPHIRQRLFWVGDTLGPGLEGYPGDGYSREEPRRDLTRASRPAPETGRVNGYWHDAVWVKGSDQKFRAIQPGVAPLADGTSTTVVQLRAYGNAINAQVAAEFIRAYMACRP